MPPFKAWLFSSDFNFACKDGWVTAETCKHYCLLVVNPTITNCCKELHLKYPEFLDLFLKTLPCIKASPVLYENQSFLLLVCNVATFIEGHCVFVCYFLQYDEVLLICLLDGCYHYLVFMDLVNGCSKSKLLVKE